MPAFANATSSRPYTSAASPTALSRAAWSVTSATAPRTSNPSPWSRDACAATAPASTSISVTRAPCAASTSPYASPSPLAPPVTIVPNPATSKREETFTDNSSPDLVGRPSLPRRSRAHRARQAQRLGAEGFANCPRSFVGPLPFRHRSGCSASRYARELGLDRENPFELQVELALVVEDGNAVDRALCASSRVVVGQLRRQLAADGDHRRRETLGGGALKVAANALGHARCVDRRPARPYPQCALLRPRAVGAPEHTHGGPGPASRRT